MYIKANNIVYEKACGLGLIMTFRDSTFVNVDGTIQIGDAQDLFVMSRFLKRTNKADLRMTSFTIIVAGANFLPPARLS